MGAKLTLVSKVYISVLLCIINFPESEGAMLTVKPVEIKVDGPVKFCLIDLRGKCNP